MPSYQSASIGIVGCGAIGRALLKAADSGMMNVKVAGVTSRTEDTARAFLSTLAAPPPYLGRDELIARSDLVVETAGGHVFPELALESVRCRQGPDGNQHRRSRGASRNY